MVQESILVDNPLKDVQKLVIQLIPKIKGKIIEISTEGDIFKWSYRFGLQTIQCETHLIQHLKQTEITTYCQSDDIWETGSKKVINKFYTSLFQGTDIKVPKTIQETSTKKTRVKPTPQTQTNKTNFKPYYIVLIVIFLIYFISRNTNDNSTLTRITNQGFKASYNKESLERFVRYSLDQDYDAMNHLIYNGEVFELPAGKEVYIVKSEFPGKVKIRLKGDTDEIWTFTEAIKE